MPKIGIEFDEAAQKKLEIPLGKRELYPSVGKYVAEILREQGVTIAWGYKKTNIKFTYFSFSCCISIPVRMLALFDMF